MCIIRSERETMEQENMFAGIPAQLREELIEPLLCGKNMRIERIVSKGHSSPPGFWYEQADDEWVLLLKGEARLRFEKDDRVLHMRAGSYVNIPAYERHRVEWTTDAAETVWLAIFHREGTGSPIEEQ